MDADIIKFPHGAKKPRRSKKGTPEERSALRERIRGIVVEELDNLDNRPSTKSPSNDMGRTCWRPYTRRGGNMHTYLFRSREAILEADEAELIEDVSCDLEKAQRKLDAARRQLKKVQEYAAEQVRVLTAVDIKLGAAIVAALLSTRREAPAPIAPEA
jgi:hypothetical protein